MDNLDYNTASSWDKIKHSFRSWRYIGVGKSLLIWFLAISIIPLASISYINFLNAYHGLTVLAEKSLHSTSLLRVENIQSYFQEIVDFLEFNSQQKEDVEFLEKLKSAYKENDSDFLKLKNSPSYQQLTSRHRDEFKNISRRDGYYDIYFIDNEGNVLFSLREESDLGKNLFTSELNHTRFAQACRLAIDLKQIRFSDLERYGPSVNILSGFFAQPVSGSEGQVVGVIALQVNMERFNNIIHQSAGYGETGQAYLIGQDLKLRSPLRFGQESVVLQKMADNQKARDWVFYLQHRENIPFLKKYELDEEKVSSYDSDNEGKYVLGIYRNLTTLEKLGVNWALIEEIEHREAFAYARKLSDIVKVSFIVTIIVVFLISILVTRWFVNPIKQLSSWGKQVAVGHLGNKRIKAPNNEVGEMVSTFNKLTGSLQSYAAVAKSMAKGDYSEQVEIRSEDDVLGKSMNQMVESFRQVVDQANRIAKGDYEQTVTPRSEQDTLGISLYEMTRTLQKNRQEGINQDWLKTGLNSLGQSISRQKNLQELASSVISFLVPYMNAQVGLMFLADPGKKELHLHGHFALEESEISNFARVPYGSGLTGQVALDRQVTTLNNIETHHKVRIGKNKITAQSYLACPLLFEEELIGVIELVSLYEFNDLHTYFIKMASESIAVAFVTATADETVKKLLKQTQEQANELAVQQEELRQANEELQEQTNALRVSEENLQSQQEELKVTNEELEERTRALELQRDAINLKNKELELARREIEQKAKDLEQASRYKSEFLANMSHELRTPLNSILVLSQILAENRKKNLDEKELEYARTINSSGSDLLDLINEILDLSKVEAGKIDLFIESMYFDDLSNYVKKTFGPIADKKSLELFVNISSNVPQMIRTDAQRLYQIIKNLYSNAIKFTHEGSITMSVFRPENQSDFQSGLVAESTIAISVSDTGIGISDDKLKLIFEAFRQADGTTSRKYGGTGLGLSISKGFAELLGGEIHVESEVGKGTTFTLFLPEELQSDTIEANPPVEVDRNYSEKGSEQASSDPTYEIKPVGEYPLSKYEKTNDDRDSLTEGDKTLLVIEDDRSFSRLLYDLAHEHRYKCLIAYDGESGLHLADYHQPHAIILDLGLPGIDGYEVINRLKNNQRTRHIPVHIISAADKSLDSLKLGAIGYLNKPVTQESLEQAFSKIDNIVNKPLRTLLIIEDDAVTRRSIENLMHDEKLRVVSVGSAESALQLLEKEVFDCIILDLGLMDMSGFEFLDIIKKQEKYNNIPVVVYTSKDLSKEEDLKLQQYAESIIMKGARSFERLLSETTLFLHQIESDLPEKKQKMLRKIHGREDILEGKTVLIVDDDMRNVFAINSLLESYKIKVINARNGLEGIKRLNESSAIDLVLMDVMMPEMDGYEAMRIIRKNPAYTRLPIIALTAKAMKDDREKCMAAGASEYLAKPVESSKLISLLRVWLYK
jgi:CheY-like chemotaxis protein/HAMP domain-containing protein/putative methionine-R-sulfoxide reductase with GAF domain